MSSWVSLVEDEVVFDAEFFEEPENTLRLGVLLVVSEIVVRSRIELLRHNL